MSQTPNRLAGLKPDEIILWGLFGRGKMFKTVREAAEFMGMHPRRARYLCRKWSEKHIYEWGFAHDLGWKEDWNWLPVAHEFMPLLMTDFYRWNSETNLVERIRNG